MTVKGGSTKSLQEPREMWATRRTCDEGIGCQDVAEQGHLRADAHRLHAAAERWRLCLIHREHEGGVVYRVESGWPPFLLLCFDTEREWGMWNVECDPALPCLIPTRSASVFRNLELFDREPPEFAPFWGVTKPSQAASAEHIPHLHPGIIISPPSPALSCHHSDTPTYATANI